MEIISNFLSLQQYYLMLTGSYNQLDLGNNIVFTFSEPKNKGNIILSSEHEVFVCQDFYEPDPEIEKNLNKICIFPN